MIAAEALDAIKARQAERSDACRADAGRSALDLAYGAHERERLDLFLPAGGRRRRSSPSSTAAIGSGTDKEPFAFLGELLVPAGAAFANIEYALCPTVSLTELTQQIRRAVAYLWREAPPLRLRPRAYRGLRPFGGRASDGDGDGDRLARSRRRSPPPTWWRAVCRSSGVYDIEPLRHTPLNDAVRMDEAEARALSPILLRPATTAPMVVVAGGDESDEFRRQARDFAAEWGAFGVEADVLIAPGTDHFTVLDTLAEPGHPTLLAAMGLLGI